MGADFPNFLKLSDVAEKLGVSTFIIRKEIKSGKLKAHFIGGLFLIAEEDLRTYLDNTVYTPDNSDNVGEEIKFDDAD